MIKYDPSFSKKETILSVTQSREPDFKNLIKILNHERPNRPTLFEFFMNDELYKDIVPNEHIHQHNFHERCLYLTKVFRRLGYDYVNISPHWDFHFPTGNHHHLESLSLNEQSMIEDDASFRNYPWPDANTIDYSYLTVLGESIPKGMKAIVYSPGGVLEITTALVGYDRMCFMLFDNPKLLQAIVDKIGSILYDYYQNCLAYDVVGACIVNDDWGFVTQTMISPNDIRQYILPWHKKFVALTHAKGRKAIMHSCGNLWGVMDDIIHDIQFDGKHSYEDNITPVEASYKKLQGSIAVLGGIDMDFICRKTPQMVYERSRKMLELSHEKGGYALGTGNSVPSYVPKENYYAMIAAALMD
ncbi:hypothetical protein HZI73_22660 [Vallitalea pronyensis]|uniref:Uroporphyrinogen decarboxylase (URO-D) domain-containing protein n=1 Tax=Vallitalea pronyensis TaxID=1348613 RepID=A0A8J8MNP1_9FIRM|nr:uroporphyrinogen decarboxylase family protein [Vallitalea pronyensis]QUI24916.1 hypothetical protein HZI73_22660 [Vallitalea pronyensis]